MLSDRQVLILLAQNCERVAELAGPQMREDLEAWARELAEVLEVDADYLWRGRVANPRRRGRRPAPPSRRGCAVRAFPICRHPAVPVYIMRQA